MRRRVAGPLALLLSGAVPAAETDWAAALRRDAAALHDLIAADHPGPVNRLDPGFAGRNDAGLALARARAARVRDYAGYLWAMRGYASSFDDGHVQFAPDRGPATLPLRWPGFLTGYSPDGRQRVLTRADEAPVPVGAELVACDGVSADRLAAARVGAFSGRWGLAGQRMREGGRLFVDAGNPFAALPRRCRFRWDGRVRTVTLAWAPLPAAEFDRRFADTAPRARPAFGARVLADGTRWYAMPGFNGDPEGPAAKALVPMIAGMRADRAALSAAPAVVLDLRGNGGGSSDWSVQVARVLWGPEATERARERSEGVDWRASPANLRAMEEYRDQWRRAGGASPEMLAWAEAAIGGMGEAMRAGRPLWREPEAVEAGAVTSDGATQAAPPPLRGPVYILTDLGCGSACLDAVDLWRALGAVQVGQETSADTLYMDVRRERLPSGAASVAVPMKVYRGRRRGSNVPWEPVHAYRGDMRDEAALAAWIATLPERRR